MATAAAVAAATVDASNSVFDSDVDNRVDGNKSEELDADDSGDEDDEPSGG